MKSGCVEYFFDWGGVERGREGLTGGLEYFGNKSCC